MSQNDLDQLVIDIRNLVVERGLYPTMFGLNIGISRAEFERIKEGFPNSPINEVVAFRAVNGRDLISVSLPIFDSDLTPV